MQIHTLNVVVPNARCVNKCPFCVSRMHTNPYPNRIEGDVNNYLNDYINRLAFVRDNGCDIAILTGTSEPLQNKSFLQQFAGWNALLGDRQFRWIELQTTGVLLDIPALKFLKTVGVTTVSLSLSDLWDSEANASNIGMPPGAKVDIDFICREIKRHDLNLRITLILTRDIQSHNLDDIITRLSDLEADQVTFKVLYANSETEQGRWIGENGVKPFYIDYLTKAVKEYGTPLARLPFGVVKYSIGGISTVVDENCMLRGEEVSSDYRYLILQPNCKLYSRWDDPASLIF